MATVGLFVRAEPYLSHHRMFSHDNLPLISYLKLSYGNAVAGRLPLWTPELNAGQPLWPVAEIAVGLDPIAGLAWLLAMAVGGSTIDVLHWACIGWLLAFSVGTVVLARRLTDDPWILSGIYGYIVLGPIWLAMPAQAYGFLLPFRYLPWVLLLFIRFIDRPTRPGGLVFGLVASLSLAGYQSLYALPVVLTFATTYALARVRQGVRPSRAHVWAALSALLAFLPVALPTGIALVYAATDLYVVARAHYQGRYSFSVGALLLDMMAPLVAPPRSWHGAFALGPGLLSLLLLGSGALLLRCGLACIGVRRWRGEIAPEHRSARDEHIALVVAWLATTAVAIALAVGSATDRFFLGLRNWGFVLTVALLGAAQLSAAAAELGRQWLEARDGFPRRALSLAAAFMAVTAMVILGFYVVVWTSPEVARECMARSFCGRDGALSLKYLAELAFGLAPFLAVLVLTIFFPPNGLAGRGKMQLYAIAFLGIVAWHVIVTLQAGPLGARSLAIPAPGQILPRAPGLAMAAPDPPQTRAALFDIRPFVPFHYEGPTVWQRAAARTLPVAFAYAPLPHPVTPITHAFRSWRYQLFVSARLGSAIEDRVLAVTVPPLRLSTKVFKARDVYEALQLLRLGTTAEASAVVVEVGLQDLPVLAPPIPSEAALESGSIRIEGFSADSIRLRVESRQPALLVYADGYDPDWSAFVNGQSVAVYPADVIGKAVPVPAGESRVELVYRPWLYIVASVLRALALLAASGVILGWLVYRIAWPGRA